MNNLTNRWFGMLCSIGILLVVVGLSMQVFRVVKRAGWWNADGVVVDVGTVVSVHFRPPGRDPVVIHLPVEPDVPARYKVGDRLSIIYPGDDPLSAEVVGARNPWFITWLLTGIGLACVAGSSFVLIPALWGRYRRSALQRKGQRIQARVTSVETYPSLSVNGRAPWRIIAQWDDKLHNKLHLFRSENLWINPEPYLKSGTVYVWVDPKRVDRYCIDTTFLPERED